MLNNHTHPCLRRPSTISVEGDALLRILLKFNSSALEKIREDHQRAYPIHKQGKSIFIISDKGPELPFLEDRAQTPFGGTKEAGRGMKLPL